ncbi:hypothetical protein Hanom_Chr17g01565561 [Helianthus anomalus]
MHIIKSYSGYTFWWCDRVAALISAIIIDHMVHADPSVTTGCNWVELLVARTLPPVGRV